MHAGGFLSAHRNMILVQMLTYVYMCSGHSSISRGSCLCAYCGPIFQFSYNFSFSFLSLPSAMRSCTWNMLSSNLKKR